MKFIITAGGQGTKVWPLSRAENPKQFQKIVNGDSLFTYNVETLLKKYNPKDIFISTKKRYVDLAKQQAPQIPVENYIIEPDVPKNRGPAEGLAFVTLAIKYPNDPFMIIQADCLRLPKEKYLKMIKEMETLVKKERKMITGGIRVDYPIMGIDYIEIGEKLPNTKLEIHKIISFIDRTKDFQKTKKLIEKNTVTTHSNHLCWYPEKILDAYKKHKPLWYEALAEMKPAIENQDREKIEKIYEKMESGATEEVTKHIMSEGYIIALPFKWIDIGTWNSIYEFFKEENLNYTAGNTIALESSRNLIKTTNENKLIAVLGVHDLVIVDTKDALLIVPREKSEKVKDLQEKIKENKWEKYL